MPTDLLIPAGYQHVMPYLIVHNAATFALFMQHVFGATEKMRHMRDEQVIMHGELTVGNSTIMYADSTGEHTTTTAGMFIYVPDADAAYDMAIAAGATAITPMSNQGYGRGGGVKDPFGNTWWITTPA